MSERGIDITTAQRKIILDLIGKHLPNTSAWAYGSRVTWKARPQSDLDMVVFATPEQAHAVANLKEAFEESDLPFRVDLFAWHEVPEQFQKNIMAEHVVLVEKREDSVPDGWKRMPFSEAVIVNPSVKLKKGQEYPFVEMKAVEPYWRNVSHSEHRVFTSGGAKFECFDTLLARITPCLENGKTGQYLPDNDKNSPAFGSTEFIVIRGKYGVTTNNFAYYLTKWQEFQSFAISQMSGSSGRQRVPTESLAKFYAPVPPLPEQRAIAHTLGTLDDKIALNRRMNATLEGMAQALFQSWFVDFDPVIDKALTAGNSIPEPLQARAAVRESLGDARKPLPENIQGLFPDAFEHTEEMGWVPMGWRVQPIESLTRLIGGGTPKTSILSYWDGDIPWFSVVDAPAPSDVYVIDTERRITQEGLNNSSTSILPVGTTIISARGTVGKCAMVGKPMAMNQSCYGVTGKSGISGYFVYYAVREKVADLQRHGHGSVFNTITRDTFNTIFIPFSGTKLTQVFGDYVNSFFQKILINCFEIQKLADTRDTFLPKLLSGELRVVDAENFLEGSSS